MTEPESLEAKYAQQGCPPVARTAPKLRPILDIAADIVRIIDMNEGEVDAQLEGLGLELEQKCEAYTIVIREYEAKEHAHKLLAKHYSEAAASCARGADRALARCDAGLKLAGVDDVKTRTAHLFYRVDRAIEVNSKLFTAKYFQTHPGLFRVPEPEPNKTALKKAIAVGEAFEGVAQVERRSLQFK